ncbi:MAG TPA: ParB/RepB/Spo0J family partition protein [Nitrososphaera sp.]|nr:ParB/RepB/Spo0J family partition protein [Nitrososphaera sp.]
MSQLGVLQEINIVRIRHPTIRLRRDLSNLEELASSIREHGLLQPIVVRPKEQEYEVVAGNRRLAACRTLKLRKITCHIVELTDKEAYEVALVENVHHKTMNPLEEAMAFHQYVEGYGWGGISELARRIGRSQEFVTKRIQLLRLPEKVQQEIIRQRITPSVALEMLPLNRDAMEQVANFIINNPLTKEEIRDIVRVTNNIEKPSSINDDVFDPSGTYVSKDKIAYEKKLRMLDKTLRKSIAVMRSTLVSFDDIINSVEDDWVIQEMLMQYRLVIHGDIDTFLKLRERLKMKLPRDYPSASPEPPIRHKKAKTERLDDESNLSSENAIHLWGMKGIWQ